MTRVLSQGYSLNPKKSLHWKAFLIALVMGTVIFLPFLIMDKGFFIYYGDFNVQQISFYRLAHDAVREGNIFWNWNTDLGVNFIGSYSFYLLFSPFFWLTLPFPSWMVPHLMAPLLILKTACAALTSYLYISRFVRNKNYAVMGSLLYAFSGWMSFNIFFNHFHEAAVFFPLLLLSVELLITEKKVGYVVIFTAVNAIVNYWFFIGEAVFVAIYVFVRLYSRGWGMTWKSFLRLLLEAILGVGIAAAVLLPSALALMGNPRTGTGELLNGWGFWIYWHSYGSNGNYAQRFFAIIQSLFFPPELPARPNFFPDHGAKWSSLSAWLPVFSLAGVFAYFQQRKNDWIKKLLALCLVFSLIPGLNSIFVLFNNSYYARWFFMPILLMAVATMRSVEDSDKEQLTMKTGIKWVLIPTTIFAIACGLTPTKSGDTWSFGLAQEPLLVGAYYLFVVIGLIILGVLVLRYRHHPKFQRYLCTGLAVYTVGFNIFYIGSAKVIYSNSRDEILEIAMPGREEINLPESDGFVRADVYKDMDFTSGNAKLDIDNLLMYWDIPGIQAFHSIVPSSIMEFYPEVGVTRDVGSRPKPTLYALRTLLSVRWALIREPEVQVDEFGNQTIKTPYIMPGFEKVDTQMGYGIYENTAFLPMGFAYDSYLTTEDLEPITKDKRGNLLLRGIVLEQDAIDRNSDLLTPLSEEEMEDLNETQYFVDVANRQQYTVFSFEIDNLGFTATSNFDTEQFIFFSVPYEKGWSATVNGEPVVIEKANIGFMAIRVPAGEATIRFDYMTPGLKEGLVISGIFLVVAALYILLLRKHNRNQSRKALREQRILGKENLRLSWDEYLTQVDPIQRRQNLNRALKQSIVRQVEEGLPEDQDCSSFPPEYKNSKPTDVETPEQENLNGE